MAVIVLELDAEVPNVAIDDVALGDEVRAPDGVEDLLSRHQPPAPAGEEVQEGLLDAAEVHHGIAGPDLAVDDVDLDLAELDRGNDRAIRFPSPDG